VVFGAEPLPASELQGIGADDASWLTGEKPIQNVQTDATRQHPSR
jgi:hypothetical protein